MKGDRTGKAAKLIRRQYCRAPEELYNLAADPYELDNLARNRSSHHGQIINRLKAELKRFIKEQGDPVKEHNGGNACYRNGDPWGVDMMTA